MLAKNWIRQGALATLAAVSCVAGAATVSIAGGATVCTTYGTLDVGATGDVVINNCGTTAVPSTNASFVVSAPGTATTGTPVSVSVTRTIGTGGVAGGDTLTLASSLSGATFSSPTVAFTAGEGIGAVSKNVNLTFSAAGSAVISVTGQGSGNSATPSAAVTVSSGGTAGCEGITPFEMKNSPPYPELPTSGYGFPAVQMAADGGSSYASASVGFTVPASYPSSGYWVFQYAENTFGVLTDLYSAISTCPGDMRGAGTGGGSADDVKCRRDPANSYLGPVISSSTTTSYCKLTPGVTYYLNLRSKNPGVTGVGFFLNAGTN